MQVLTREWAADVSLRDVIIAQDETGWQGVNDVTHWKRAEVFVNLKKESWKLDTERGGSTFGACWGETNLRAMDAVRDRGQMKKPT